MSDTEVEALCTTLQIKLKFLACGNQELRSGLRHVKLCEVSSLVRKLCNQLFFQVERLLMEDFLKTENYLIFEREVVSFYINRLRLPQ